MGIETIAVKLYLEATKVIIKYHYEYLKSCEEHISFEQAKIVQLEVEIQKQKANKEITAQVTVTFTQINAEKE